MTIEGHICDSDVGLFHQFNTLLKTDSIKQEGCFFTYRVLPIRKDDKTYGYSEFVPGKLVYDEDKIHDLKFGDPTESFMKLNDAFPIIDDYLPLLEVRKKALASKDGVALLKNPERLEELSQGEDIIHLLEAIYKLPEPFNEGKVALELLANPQKVSSYNFFEDRTPNQLENDLLLFTALDMLKITDLHAGNFICHASSSKLVLIDIECSDSLLSLSGKEILPLIEDIYLINEQQFPEEKMSLLIKGLEDCLDEFEEKKQGLPQRYVPVATKNLYSMFVQYFEEDKVNTAIKNIMDNMENEGFTFLVEVEELERELMNCCKEFEIPYFTIVKNVVYLNNISIAEKKDN